LSATTTNLIDDLRLLEAPLPWLPWAWLALVLAVAGAWIYWRWRRRQSRARPADPVAVIQEDALAELEKLRPLIAVATSRAYAIGASGVVRRFIGRWFGIEAPRRSTEEFLAEARNSPLLDEHNRRNLGEFLAGCDFLKFAQARAEVPELELLHEAARIFITEQPVAAASPAGVPAPEPPA
jgi:hypothetical protein